MNVRLRGLLLTGVFEQTDADRLLGRTIGQSQDSHRYRRSVSVSQLVLDDGPRHAISSERLIPTPMSEVATRSGVGQQDVRVSSHHVRDCIAKQSAGGLIERAHHTRWIDRDDGVLNVILQEL